MPPPSLVLSTRPVHHTQNMSGLTNGRALEDPQVPVVAALRFGSISNGEWEGIGLCGSMELGLVEEVFIM